MKIPGNSANRLHKVPFPYNETLSIIKKICSIRALVVLIAAACLFSCSEDELKPTGGENYFFIDPNILHTDEYGIVLGGDTTDWCQYSSTTYSFPPAFPNPTRDTVKIKFAVPQIDTISVAYQKTNGDTVYLLRNEILNAGMYQFTVSGRTLMFSGSTRRFFFFSRRFPIGDPFCRNYGDVQFY